MRSQLYLLMVLCAGTALTLGCQPPEEAATTEPAAEAPPAPAPDRAADASSEAPSPRGETGVAPASKAQGKPNIVVIWGDDIGISNLSVNTEGLMGYHTPNIDRIAREGMKFTDYYAEQSCTAGRSAFITGQSVFRTGLSKVGLPGATQGLSDQDPTIAELLKNHGYATGQFGKNHLGDRNEFLPTVHGFDEFYGNLYHLNAEEEPEERDYPKNPAFKAKYGPRGVMDCKASDRDDKTVDPRFGKMGKQVCKDTGPLTRKRMETIDDDIAARAQDFMQRQAKADKPFFLWVNFTHMHLWTHTKPESLGQAGEFQSAYHDTMIDHDKNVGSILDKIDKLGIAENTIVIYGTDNGPAHERLARWRNDPVSQREEHRVGGRISRAFHGALAGQDQGGHGFERDHVEPRLGAHLACGRRGTRRQREAPDGPQGRGQEVQGAPRRLQLPPLPHGSGDERPPYRVFLFFRRRGFAGPAARQLEGAFQGSRRAWNYAALAAGV